MTKKSRELDLLGKISFDSSNARYFAKIQKIKTERKIPLMSFQIKISGMNSVIELDWL